MVEDARKDPRLIGGVYQVGQVITNSPTLTTYTAYNRNTSDVVGLLVFELPPTVEAEAALRLLEPLERRRLVESPHVIHVFDWGIDGSRIYIATDPPRGISLRAVLDSETLDLKRAVEMAKQMVRGLIALQAQNIEKIDMRPQLITVDMVVDTDQVLQDLVDRALAKEPTQRFLNAEALLKALETLSIRSEAPGASLTLPTDELSVMKSGVRTDEMPSILRDKDAVLGSTLIEDSKTVRQISLDVEEEGVYAYLYFEKEGEEARRFAIKDKYVVVGRVDPKRGLKPEVDLTSIDPGMTVSRQHARIRFEKTFFSIEDLKSHNKTRLGELT